MQYLLCGIFYIAGCFIWSCYSLKQYVTLVSAFQSLDAETKKHNEAFERHDLRHLSKWRMVFGASFLFPIRLAVFCSFLLNFLFWTSGWTSFCRFKCGLTEVLKACFETDCGVGRQVFHILEAFTGRLGLFLAGVYRIKQERNGKPCPAPSGFSPCNIVSNHVSPMDILFYMSYTHASFVAKQEVASNRLVGPLACAMDCVFVNRSCSNDRERVFHSIKERQHGVAMGHKSRSFVVFPEGTTTNGRYVIPFKKGAFFGDSPLQLAALTYECPDFDIACEVVPSLTWFTLVLTSPGPISLTVSWLDPLGASTNDAGQKSHSARKAISEIVFNRFKGNHKYSQSGEELHLWEGSYRGKAELMKQMKQTKKFM
eukprot:GHVN01004254.1.p1 GENE.GHVN01004254.1~~GHVN01004254.1.p1  ORF type:complete len:394 (-),score=16.29 GHVN01004254.1:2437-3546(-)